MKSRLTTLDIVSLIKELEQALLGLRVDQVYDVDKKTYLIRLAKTDVKKVLVLESGVRFHTTTFEWPKNPAPSGFSMKLRKHLNNKRLEKISQLGADRIVDFQFGTEAFTHHVILELYDKGNIVLTDDNYNILSLLRPRILGEERLAAHEQYAVEKAKQDFSLSKEEVETLVNSCPGKSLREVFLSKIEFGPALFSHVLRLHGFAMSNKIPSGDTSVVYFGETLFKALEEGRQILENFKPEGGFIVLSPGDSGKSKKKGQQQEEISEKIPLPISNSNELVFYDQFHPQVLLPSFENSQTISFPTLNLAVDDFFSKIESQKIDMKQMNQEKDALKKLEKVKLDQLKRLDELKVNQDVDKHKAELISMNQTLVDAAISAVRKLVANQIPWNEIWEQIQEAKANEDPLASSIQSLNLIKNQFTVVLRDPYETPDGEPKLVSVDIDLDLSAYANATKYYDLKRQSAKKEERTLESQEKAFKSTEKRTMATLKEVATIHSIKKARKVYWFEKFRWCISSENYLILGGRDAQQNELLVKRYLRPKDIYLHADAHGAPTIIIKNDTPDQPVLPKTLNEAGCFAVASSGSWESKVIVSSWWVYGDQVSKSAPTGEYLPTGSFMIRGKKNYLPPTQLVLGFGFLFRLTDESIEKHKNERPRRFQSISGSNADQGKTISSEEKNSSLPAEPSEEVNKKESEAIKTESETPAEDEFPDTQVKLRVDGSSNRGRVRTQTLSTMSVSSDTASTFLTEGGSNLGDGDVDESQNTVIISSGIAPIAISAQKLRSDKKKAEKKDKKDGVVKSKQKSGVPAAVKEEIEEEKESTQQQQKAKRGQHGRNKKLKEKYRFQDEEDRELRMLLIRGGEGANSAKKGKTKNSSDSMPSPVKQKTGGPRLPTVKTNNTPLLKPKEKGSQELPKKVRELSLGSKENTPVPEDKVDVPDVDGESKAPMGNEGGSSEVAAENLKLESTPQVKVEEQEQESEEEQEEGPPESESNLLNSLTGSPQDEDELLFAIPVVAPYVTLQNYKFKIKMVPGSAKRGKAARSALESFLRDKTASPREKDLLKSVKDQDLARNFPGKVKLSMTHDKR